MRAGVAVPHGPSAPDGLAYARGWLSAYMATECATASANAPGLVLTTLGLEPIYTNSEALQILGYPASSANGAGEIQGGIRRVLRADRFTASAAPITFLSGRREYLCRAFLLDPRIDEPQSCMGALLLERRRRDPIGLSEMSRRYRLSPRESETVRHLIRGLTTKEVAQRMRVSPNTVKQFVRIAMNKLGVTTRSGIVGKMLG